MPFFYLYTMDDLKDKIAKRKTELQRAYDHTQDKIAYLSEIKKELIQSLEQLDSKLNKANENMKRIKERALQLGCSDIL